jgi:hypothetical protein
MRKILASSLVAIVSIVVFGVAIARAGGSDVRISTGLAGATINGLVPKGVAEFRARADGSRQLKVQVENVNLEGAILNVLINNSKVGEITIDALLAGQLQLNTRDGQTVPPVGRGSTAVVTDQTGTTIVAGTF